MAAGDNVTTFNPFVVLVGKTIESVFLVSDDVLLFFLAGGEQEFFSAETGCGTCAQAHFSNPDDFGLDQIIGRPILRSIARTGEQKENGSWDTISFVFYELSTDHGSATIEMRTSSDGSYDGYALRMTPEQRERLLDDRAQVRLLAGEMLKHTEGA